MIIEGQKIRTDRLLLRKFTKDDLDDFYNILSRDEVGRQLPKGEGFSRSEVKKWLENIINFWEKNDYGVWAVTIEKSQNFIGYCGLNYIQDINKIEILYSLSPEFWNRGYATEAARAVIIYGFKKLKLDRIVGFTKLGNTPSERVLKKAGLKYVEIKDIFGMKCKYYQITNDLVKL